MMHAMNDSAERVYTDFPYGAGHRTGLLLARVGTVLNEIADERLAPAGVSGRGYSILAILAVVDPDTQYEIARLLGKAPGVVVRAIDELERNDLVTRTRDPSDRRRSRVTLTPAGWRTLLHADQLADEATASVLSGLDRDELAQLRALLAKALGLRE
jgi:DNA-binding MarR family transcriptional regulator